MGYHQAGWDVIGVDLLPRPNYPFPFLQADLLSLDLNTLAQYVHADLLHGSPPCQKHTTLTKGNALRAKPIGKQHPDLIAPTRESFLRTGLPWVIENVPKAPIRSDIILCGEMFGLKVIRHRHFELYGWEAPQPKHKTHRGRVAGWRHGEKYEGYYVAVYGQGGGKGSVEEWQAAMDIGWTPDRVELAEAIPPAYTRYLGSHAIGDLIEKGLI